MVHFFPMTYGYFSSLLNVSDFSRFLEDGLCWYDGTPTHRSSGAQRQCPKCRTKWNFEGRRKYLRLLLEYCKGTRAGDAGRIAGSSRNTAQTTFRKLDRRVTRLVKKFHRRGGIALITDDSTMLDLERLRKHHGRRTPAEAVSRRIFFHGLNAEERVQRLIAPDLEEALRTSLGRLSSVARKALPNASGLMELRVHLTEREWDVYTRVAMER
jgi:hypothetical protein